MKKKDFKLYADECLGQDLVDHLREIHNLNVKVIEERLLGKSDEKILMIANEKRRFLLTRNSKHFFANDNLCPFKGLFGIISLKAQKYWPCNELLWLAKHDKQSLIGKKFLVSHGNVSVRYICRKSIKRKEMLTGEDCSLCYPV
jgi:hypothetical protein